MNDGDSAAQRSQFVVLQVRDAAEVDHGLRLRRRQAHSASRIATPQREEPKNISVLCKETIATQFTSVVYTDQLPKRKGRPTK